MSFPVIGRLVVVAGAALITYHVFAPRNRQYFDRMAQIPLDDDTDNRLEETSE